MNIKGFKSLSTVKYSTFSVGIIAPKAHFGQLPSRMDHYFHSCPGDLLASLSAKKKSITFNPLETVLKKLYMASTLI